MVARAQLGYAAAVRHTTRFAARRDLYSLRYVLVGSLAGAAYAGLNTAMDYWHGHGVVARAFVALHKVVDDVIPLVVGALLGVAVHYLRIRSRLAQEERSRADALRARLQHVERHQAVWVVAAATLHEIKNPLHSMGLLVDELESLADAEPATARDLAQRIRAQFDRALVPLDALRALARSQGHEGRSEPIAEIAAQVAHELEPVLRERGVSLEITGNVPSLARAKSSYLRIILENLIGNSLECLQGGSPRREPGHIRLALEAAEGSVCVSVSDDGPGLQNAAPETLFRPLETSKAGGLGLGLPIARALARAMDGDLVLRAVDGWSTTFRLTLPTQPAMAHAEREPDG